MKLKVILILSLSAFPLFAQIDATAKNVELPTFVITGKETVEFPAAEKLPSPPVTVVSEDFLKPSYEPDFLQGAVSSNPFTKVPLSLPSEEFYRNKLLARAGNVTLPSVTYSTMLNSGDLSASARLGTEYVLPYVKNSSSFLVSPQLDLDYKIIQPGSFFDENKIHVNANYKYEKYNLNWIDVPTVRKVSAYGIGATLENSTHDFWKYEAGFNTHTIGLLGENNKESRMGITGAAGFSGQNLDFTPNAELSYFSVFDSAANRVSNTMLRVDAPLKITISDVFSAFASMHIMFFDSIKTMDPNFGLQLRLNSYISLAASYSPGYVVDDFSAQISRNRFAAMNQKQLLVYPVKGKIDFGITFESAKVYDITLGFSTFNSDYYPYFTDRSDGKYELKTTNSTAFDLHADLRIHPSALGYFISSLQINAIKDTAGNFLPNYPAISAYAVYGYTLQKGITLKAGGKFMSKRYIDAANTETLPLYISLFGELGYSFSREFLLTAKIDNLLNRKNLIFKGYQDRPLTLEVGIEFQW